MTDYNSYNTGHPWYYVLGGKVPSIKAIWKEVAHLDYKGCKEDDIKKAAGNSSKLRALKAQSFLRLKNDISSYRKYALELHRYRKSHSTDDHLVCEDIHVSLSLKNNHIYNELAHLRYIEELLSYQPDLFDFG